MLARPGFDHLRGQHFDVRGKRTVYRLREGEDNIDIDVAHCLGQTVTRRAEATADEGRKFPSKHKYLHAKSPLEIAR